MCQTTRKTHPQALQSYLNNKYRMFRDDEEVPLCYVPFETLNCNGNRAEQVDERKTMRQYLKLKRLPLFVPKPVFVALICHLLT